MSLVFDVLSGEGIAPFVPDLARLRVGVFRDWPYLYEGSLDYERKYLAKYVRLARATVVLARDGDAVVGASTALPLVEAEAELRAPFLDAGLDPAEVYYYGESVLLAPYRGRGAGVRFFAEREGRARAFGFGYATFCGVVRPPDHPARPPDYVPLDAFWTKRGFVPRPDLMASFEWRDVGGTVPTRKPMAFWLKSLRQG
ncbi:MAG: GNAT family N-acetyltransferase [Magnetospirillum sp.]|nr:GNAT family N-acetyltransferase [Magnetospirillum sp.]